MCGDSIGIMLLTKACDAASPPGAKSKEQQGGGHFGQLGQMKVHVTSSTWQAERPATGENQILRYCDESRHRLQARTELTANMAKMLAHEHASSALGRPALGAIDTFRALSLLPVRSPSLKSALCGKHQACRARRQEASSRPVHCSAAVVDPVVEAPQNRSLDSTKPKVIIAGAGIGGLVLAVGLLNKGFPVQCLERDLTAIRGEGKYRGPIQVLLWCSADAAAPSQRHLYYWTALSDQICALLIP